MSALSGKKSPPEAKQIVRVESLMVGRAEYVHIETVELFVSPFMMIAIRRGERVVDVMTGTSFVLCGEKTML